MTRNGVGALAIGSRAVRAIEGYAFACWLFCSLVAVLRPARLAEAPLALPVHIRTDTLGIVFFVVLGSVTVPRRWLANGRNWRGQTHLGGNSDCETCPVSDAVLAALRDLTGVLAAYVGVSFLAHPQSMALPLTHVVPWPSERATGVGALAFSWSASLLLAVLRGNRPQVQA